jgi:hypothetical protein
VSPEASAFLPIARTSVSVPLIVGVGGMMGLLSGLFGVGALRIGLVQAPKVLLSHLAGE